jgi:CRP-like cAMP-binding protein
VLRSNELIGEMGVIRNRPRGATVRAKTPVRALRIASEVFLGLITENKQCALDVMRQLSARLDASNARLAATQREVEGLRNQAARTAAAPGRDAKA